MGYNSIHEFNINVFNDTQELIRTNNILKNSIQLTKQNTEFIKAGKKNSAPSIKTKVFYNNVFVTKNKTIEAALKLHKKDPLAKIAILNFASATNPGGGVKKGSSAQEESICRCSTLYNCLDTKFVLDNFYYPNRKTSDQFHTDDIVYTPGVVICKSDDKNYTRLSETEFLKVDVITCAAPNLRERPNNAFNSENVVNKKLSDQELYELHLSRARAILSAAKTHKIDILVLGAFGCGAFKNDPHIVAKAYKEAIKDFINDFTEIEFAIYCRNYETENFDAFEKEFEK